MPFQSQAQWRWAFATHQEFADAWAKMTPGGKRRFQLLAKRKRTKSAKTHTPPQSVRDAAQRGLDLRREFGRGGTAVGIARARDLSNGTGVSDDTIARMVSFFARHAVDKRPDWANPTKPSNGYIAHMLWGGDAGRTWANSINRTREKDADMMQHITIKHLPGKHDQSSHGKPGRVGGAFRSAYSAARSGGASHTEARNAAKTAAEQVRETIRGEKREERAANPKPKRNNVQAPDTTKWQAFLDKSKAEFAAAQDAYQSAINDKNATTESLTAAQRARDAAGEKWTRDQHTANQMAAVESAAPPKAEARNQDAPKAEASTPKAEPLKIGSPSTYGEALTQQLQDLQQQYATTQQPLPKDWRTAKFQRIATENLRADVQFDKQAEDLLIQEHLRRNPGLANDPEYMAKVANLRTLQQQRIENVNAGYQVSQARVNDSHIERSARRAIDDVLSHEPKVEAPATPTSKRAQLDSETQARYDRIRARAERRLETGIDERTGKKLKLAVRVQEEANLRVIEEATGETVPYLQRIRNIILPASEFTVTTLGGRKPDAPSKTQEIGSRISRIDTAITTATDRRNAARQRESDARSRLAEAELSNGKGVASANALTLAKQDYFREQTARKKLDDELKQLDKDRKAQARELSQAERDVRAQEARIQERTKADESPRKYGARAGEVIAGNLGRDTGGKFTRVGNNPADIVRAAINRGFASGEGKRSAKRAAVSDAQKRRQMADTGAGVMDALGFDASDWDYLASDKPQDPNDPQFSRLIAQGLMDNVDGMAYPSALGRKIAAAAGAGNEDKAKELLARDTAKRSTRQAKFDAQIAAYDEVINDETASPRARAIATRKRTLLIGKSGTRTKDDDGSFARIIERLKHLPGKHDQSVHGKPVK